MVIEETYNEAVSPDEIFLRIKHAVPLLLSQYMSYHNKRIFQVSPVSDFLLFFIFILSYV
jgi:hypothetical protein